jgi:5-methylcytosine-specific restriction endonuclease McrA/biotin operon repressor
MASTDRSRNVSTPEQLAYAKAYRMRLEVRAKERERGRQRAREDSERARNRNHARRIRYAGQYVERVESLVVLERADGVCGICGQDVDPLRFHVDHVVPLSRGGVHAYSNVQPAHPSCNVRKHNAYDGESLPSDSRAGWQWERLHRRDVEMVTMLAAGHTYGDVGRMLGISGGAVALRVRVLRGRGWEVTTRGRGHRKDPSNNGRRSA